MPLELHQQKYITRDVCTIKLQSACLLYFLYVLHGLYLSEHACRNVAPTCRSKNLISQTGASLRLQIFNWLTKREEV